MQQWLALASTLSWALDRWASRCPPCPPCPVHTCSVALTCAGSAATGAVANEAPLGAAGAAAGLAPVVALCVAAGVFLERRRAAAADRRQAPVALPDKARGPSAASPSSALVERTPSPTGADSVRVTPLTPSLRRAAQHGPGPHA